MTRPRTHDGRRTRLPTTPPSSSHPPLPPLRIDERLFKMMEDDLDISRAVETRYVATLALRKQRDVLEDLLHHGEISKLDAAKLRGALPALSRPPCLAPWSPS